MGDKNKKSNNLSLAERVQMIKEYVSGSPKPSLDVLARKYAVNYSLIRNIILNKELFLSAYAKSKTKTNKTKSAIEKTNITLKQPFKLADSKHNRLSLLERIKVINEYKLRVPRTTINALASKYKVSNKQIMNILDNQESILKLYQEAGETSSVVVDDYGEREIKQRQHKMNFLGKVLYEYVQRTLYHKIKIDNTMLLKKAKEIAECIAIKDFRPTFAWLDHFNKIYGTAAFQTESIEQTTTGKVSKCSHWDTVDIVQYVVYQKCRRCDIEMVNASGKAFSEKIIQQNEMTSRGRHSHLQSDQVIPHKINPAIETCNFANELPVPKDLDDMSTKKKQSNSLSLPERLQIITELNPNLSNPISHVLAKTKQNNSTQNRQQQRNTNILLTNAVEEGRRYGEVDQLNTNNSKENTLNQDSIALLPDPSNPTNTSQQAKEGQIPPPPLYWHSLRGFRKAKPKRHFPTNVNAKEIPQLTSDLAKENLSDTFGNPQITYNLDNDSCGLIWTHKNNDAITVSFEIERSHILAIDSEIIGNSASAVNSNPTPVNYPKSILNGISIDDSTTIKIETPPTMLMETGVAMENVNDAECADDSIDISCADDDVSIKSEISSDAEEFLDDDSSVNPKTNEPCSRQLLNASDAKIPLIELDHLMEKMNDDDPVCIQRFPNSQIMQMNLAQTQIEGHQTLANTENETERTLKDSITRIADDTTESRLLPDASKDQHPTLMAIGSMKDAMPHLNLLKDYALLKNSQLAVSLVNLLAGALHSLEEENAASLV